MLFTHLEDTSYSMNVMIDVQFNKYHNRLTIEHHLIIDERTNGNINTQVQQTQA
jgi:hypothetical protein